MSDPKNEQPTHEIEQSPRRYSKKEYPVMVRNEDGSFSEKKIRLDLTPQVHPVGFEPLSLPSQAEVNAQAVKSVEEGWAGDDPLMAALALNSMRQTPTDEQPEGDIDLLNSPGIPTAAREPLTREVALKQLADYLGVNVEDIQGRDPRRGSWLADNLGTLVSSLDGTEEFVAEMRAVAKHPRFYFKKALPRARNYLAKAAKLVEDFPWEYSSSPSDAIRHLREAQGFIGYAVTAVTGRGSETPELDRYNEDGVIARGGAFQDTRESSLEWHIKSYKRLVSILEALKLKRDAMLQAGKKPDETLANNDLIEAIRTAVQEGSK